jgi:hypothetical protein
MAKEKEVITCRPRGGIIIVYEDDSFCLSFYDLFSEVAPQIDGQCRPLKETVFPVLNQQKVA